MEAATALRLANEFPDKIIGVKEASGDMKQIAEIIAGKPDGFQVVSGDDALTLRLIRMGAEGVISVIGNALPHVFGKLVHLALDNFDNPIANEIDQRLQPLDRALFAEGNPSGLKCLLSHMGLAKDVLRLPLVPVSDMTRKDIALALAAVTKTEFLQNAN